MVSAADHRGTAGHSASEVLEEDATGDIKGIYDDIRDTLRVPFVPDVFLSLATEPDYLGLAWRQLHTNAQTLYFEQSADAIRRFAVQRTRSLVSGPSSPGDDVTSLVQTYNYVLPKVVLAVTALRVATTGQRPRLADIPAEQKRQVASGVPAGMPAPRAVPAESVTPQVQEVFQSIRTTLRTPTVSTEFRMLAASPQYFESAWKSVQELSEHGQITAMQRELRLMAEEVVLALPFRMDLSPHTLRHSGLSERGIDRVRAILDRFQSAVPMLALGTAVLAVGAVGAERASTSAFPADVL